MKTAATFLFFTLTTMSSVASRKYIDTTNYYTSSDSTKIYYGQVSNFNNILRGILEPDSKKLSIQIVETIFILKAFFIVTV